MVLADRLQEPRHRLGTAQVIAAGVFEDETSFDETEDADFDFGLQLYLDGVAKFIDRMGARRTDRAQVSSMIASAADLVAAISLAFASSLPNVRSCASARERP